DSFLFIARQVLGTIGPLQGITVMQWRELVLQPLAKGLSSPDLSIDDCQRFSRLIALASTARGRVHRKGLEIAEKTQAFHRTLDDHGHVTLELHGRRATADSRYRVKNAKPGWCKS